METRHIFIINPAAGVRDRSSAAVRRIEEACGRHGAKYDIYLTTQPGHACEIVRRVGAANEGRRLIFYACGGDGTLNEVADGMVALNDDNCAFTAYPIGTGNDFIKIFSEGRKAFLDLDRLLTGDEIKLDAIVSDCGCAANILSVGIDAQVTMRKGKYKFLGSGTLPYCAAAVESVIKGIGREYYVTVDGKSYDGDYTLIFVGNGRVYGGGFCPVPEAMADDGRLEVLLVDRITRRRAAYLVPKYKKGKYKELSRYITHLSASEITIFSKDNEDMCINLDGEIVSSSHISMRVEPGRLRFIVPKGVRLAQ